MRLTERASSLPCHFPSPLLLNSPHPRQGILGQDEIRLDAQGLLVVPDGLLHPACLNQRIPQVVVRVGIIRLDAQGLLVLADGLLHSAQSELGDSQVIVRVGIIGFDP